MNKMRKITSAFVAGEMAEPPSQVIGSPTEFTIKTKAKFGGFIQMDATGIDPNGYYTFEVREGDTFHVFTDIQPRIADGMATFEMWVDLDKVLSKSPSDAVKLLKEARSTMESEMRQLRDCDIELFKRIDNELAKHNIRFTD